LGQLRTDAVTRPKLAHGVDGIDKGGVWFALPPWGNAGGARVQSFEETRHLRVVDKSDDDRLVSRIEHPKAGPTELVVGHRSPKVHDQDQFWIDPENLGTCQMADPNLLDLPADLATVAGEVTMAPLAREGPRWAPPTGDYRFTQLQQAQAPPKIVRYPG
jgi:hypothetical protein